MGRLFWKFFFAFWLALLIAGVGVGSAVWLRQSSQQASGNNNQHNAIDVQHAASMVSVATSIVPHGGIEALRDFIGALQKSHMPPVFAVDDADRDILDRSVSPEILQQARNLFAKGNYPEAIQSITTVNGAHYLLFVPLPEHGFADTFNPILPSHETEEFDFDRPPPPPDHDHGPGHHMEFGPHQPGPPHERHASPPSPAISIVAGSLASILFSALLAWYFAKPIRSLRTAFNSVAQGRLDTRIGTSMSKRSDELADLGRDFDHMTQQICSLVDSQQHLLHDVSHELRSPLARIQAAIGLAQQQPDKLPATLERIERESQRMSDLVGELLMLSRLEAGVSKEASELIDIGDLLADIIEDVRFEAEHNGVSLCYIGIGNVTVKCRSELLHRAIENVVRNAVQHCKPSGLVSVEAKFDKQRYLRIFVDDQGPGVPEKDIAAIFQPFFRSGNHQKPHSTGLGLTIAYRAIEAHHGRIQASNRPEGGLRVEIHIPFPIENGMLT